MQKPVHAIAAIYRCPVCNKEYPSEDLARACLNSTPEPRFKVGDIVIIREGYTWNDGLDHWVVGGKGRANPDATLEKLAFYFVITSIDSGDPEQSTFGLHRNIYSVQTLGLKNGMPGGRGGWNSDGSHYRMELAEDPPALVVSESKALIGKKFYNLL